MRTFSDMDSPTVAETPIPANPSPSEAIATKQPSPAFLKHRFTRENAREMNARAWASRRQRDEDLRKAADPLSQGTDKGYAKTRLARVRAQLERIDDMVGKETDPQKLDRLASAQARLSEQERILAGRPLPGSHRPTKARDPQANQSYEPEE